jgi:serine phosphatase RsbU (regulator of sigma subunit)
LQTVHETVRRLGNREFHVTALIGRWYAATNTFTWVNCGHPDAFVVDVDGEVTRLVGDIHEPLGVGPDDREFEPTSRQFDSDERLILVTDGVTERKVEGGGTFGIDGIRKALADSESATAAATAMAILQGVTDCCREPLEDDGTVLVLRVA